MGGKGCAHLSLMRKLGTEESVAGASGCRLSWEENEEVGFSGRPLGAEMGLLGAVLVGFEGIDLLRSLALPSPSDGVC